MTQTNWIGQKLNGRYEIIELLGQGGMSAVYKANDPNLKRIVAVKLIHPHLSTDPAFVRRFEAEAAAVAKLRHPHIIQVYDFNHAAQEYYIVFEFVPGETLQERLARLHQSGRQFDVEEVVDIIAKTADALAYAHSKGLIHRDIKPANIMINVMGEPIVTDFGIARIMGETQHTATGAVLGTAKYMSPEQIKGEQIDGRTDIYALGATLYEMLAGQPPFMAENPMTLMMMHVTDPPPDVREMRADVPAALTAVIDKALAKKAADRYQNAADFAAALRGALSAAPQPPVAFAGGAATMVEAPPEEATIVETGSTEVLAATGAAAAAVPPAPPITPPPPIQQSAGGGGSKKWLFIGGGVLLLAILALIGFFALSGGGDDQADADATATAAAVALLATDEAAADAEATDAETGTAVSGTSEALLPAAATSAPTKTSVPTPTPKPSPTTAPLATSTTAATATTPPTATTIPPTATTMPPTATTMPPTATAPTTLSAAITGITTVNGRYSVDYVTYGYTEQLSGQHVHFYWNNISQDQAGVGPTAASWILYGGPRPFTGYAVSDRPADASAMCVIVANADHTIILNSGNCMPLP
jgi:serine/threonine-protein kinase